MVVIIGALLILIMGWLLTKLQIKLITRVLINSALLSIYGFVLCFVKPDAFSLKLFVYLIVWTVIGITFRLILPFIHHANNSCDTKEIPPKNDFEAIVKENARIQRVRLTFTMLKIVLHAIFIASLIWDLS